MKYDDLKSRLNEYNWDDGFEIPKQILDDSNCDLALALEIFYLGDGYGYFECSSDAINLEKWMEFISNLYNEIVDGKYVKTDNNYTIPLSKDSKYKLQKKNVPDVFLTDL